MRAEFASVVMRRIREIIPSVEGTVVAQLNGRKDKAFICKGYTIVKSVKSVKLCSRNAVNGAVGIFCCRILESQAVVIIGVAGKSCLEIEPRSGIVIEELLSVHPVLVLSVNAAVVAELIDHRQSVPSISIIVARFLGEVIIIINVGFDTGYIVRSLCEGRFGNKVKSVIISAKRLCQTARELVYRFITKGRIGNFVLRKRLKSNDRRRGVCAR